MRYQFPFARFPAVRLAVLFCAGIMADYRFELSQFMWLAGMGSSIIIVFYVDFLKRDLPSPGLYRLGIAAYLLCVFLSGGWRHAASSRPPGNAPEPAALLKAWQWETLEFHGKIMEVKPPANGRLTLDIQVWRTTLPSVPVEWHHPFRLRNILKVHSGSTGTYRQIPVPGSTVRYRATIYPLEGPRNPGAFDYASYLRSKNIAGQAGIDSILSVGEPDPGFDWIILRHKTMQIIHNNFGDSLAPLAKALLAGYKNELGQEEKRSFSRAGLSHIMAVSGLHVGFIIAPLWIIIPYLWTWKGGKAAGLAFLAGTLLLYAGLTGFSASVCRASLTGGLITYGRLYHKVRDPINLTAVSAFALLLADPGSLFDIGFQLSFAAVYVILLVIPAINRSIPPWVRFRWYGTPIMIVVVSVVVQVGLYPLLGYYFGEFSVIGPLANALVVPFLSLAVPASLVLLVLSVPFPAAGAMLNAPNRWILRAVEYAVETMASWQWSWISVQIDGWLPFLVWGAGIFLAASLHLPALRWRLGSLLLLLLCLQQAQKIGGKLSEPTLEVLVFDVGQGDAALLSTPAGSHFLIDTGRWSPGYNSARHTIIPYLQRNGIKKLDAVFLSHPHADHIGGMAEIIDAIPIDTIYNSGFPYSSALYAAYRRKAAEQEIPVISLKAGAQVYLDSSIRIFIYGPGPGTPGSDPNDRSLVMEVHYGNTEFLFTGDAGKEQEQAVIADFGELANADFLKVGHHGSRTSSSSVFLAAVRPGIAVVSLARQNRFGHPHREAINRLRKPGMDLHFTSLDKALLFRSDGKAIRRINW